MKQTGTIETFNISPKGFYEGFLLRTGKGIVQINLPKQAIGTFGNGLSSGEQVTAEVEPEQLDGEPEHRVFRLLRLLDANGQKPDESNHENGRFAGRIERLNYALHGEVNGGILDSGDFLHLKPEGARAIELKAGVQVEGRGSTKPMVGGGSVIEPEEVNGVAISHHKAKKRNIRSTPGSIESYAGLSLIPYSRIFS